MSIPTVDDTFERENGRWSLALAGLETAATGVFEDGATRLMAFVAGSSDEPYVGYIGLTNTDGGQQCRFGALEAPPQGLTLEDLARGILGTPPKNDLKAFFVAAGDLAKSRQRLRPARNPLLDDFLANVDLLATRAHYLVRQDSIDTVYDEIDGTDDQIDGLASYDEFHALSEPGRSLVRDWPWMLKEACRPGTLLPVSDGEASSRYAARVLLEICGRTGLPPLGSDVDRRLAAVLELVRGHDLGFTFGTLDDGLMCGLIGLADMPPEWIPTPLDEVTEDEWCTAVAIAEQSYRLGRLIDRSPRSFVKTFPGSWEERQRDISNAAGIFDPVDSVAYARLIDHCMEMLSSFEKSVLRPALARLGFDAGQHASFDTLAGDQCQPSGARGSVREMSAKLLLRDKGWRSIAELSAAWSVKTHAIATVEARLAEHTNWKVPFELLTFEMPEGAIEIKALASAQDLLDEGVDGIDSNGMEGMGHCVPSYMAACAEGRSIVVSIRRRDASGTVVRVSTAELSARYRGFGEDATYRLEVVQHYARDNSAPPHVARVVLGILINGEMASEIARTMLVNINHDVPDTFYDPDRPGAIEAMLAAWEFALSREVRKLSVEEFAKHAVALTTQTVSEAPGSGPSLRA